MTDLSICSEPQNLALPHSLKVSRAAEGIALGETGRPINVFRGAGRSNQEK